jgi:hypothetical protein
VTNSKEINTMNPSRKKTPLDSVAFWVLAPVLFCFLVIAVLWIAPLLTTSPREKMQQDLAKELGVDIRAYPSQSTFPSGYFFTVLKPGMPISEVHNIVRNYEKVLRCGHTMEEYYYLSEIPEDAERFRIFYDKEGRFERLQSEGDDSGILPDDWCSPGLLEE